MEVFWVSEFGFCVSDFVYWVPGFVFRVSGFESRVPGFGFRVTGLGFEVSGFRFRVSEGGKTSSKVLICPMRCSTHCRGFRVQGSSHTLYLLNGLRKSTPPQNRHLALLCDAAHTAEGLRFTGASRSSEKATPLGSP